MRRALKAAIVLATALTVSLPLAADAHKKGWSSNVSIEVFFTGGSEIVRGQVSSASARCLGNRTVDVYENGTRYVTVKTDSNGTWGSDPATRAYNGNAYHAVVLKKVMKRAGHRHVCRSGQSDPVTNS